MAYFERAYNISWFEFGPTIYLYRPSDWSTSRLYVGEYDVSTKWDDLLKKSGLQQKKFSVFYSAQQSELVVSGPRSYIQLVRSTFEVERPAPPVDTKTPPEVKEPEFMVFPLKYASVEDRTIKLRGKEYVTPGVFTVFKNVLGGALGANQIPIDEDAYGFKGIQLGVMANPGTALKAAGQVVRKTVRGEEPADGSFFPNGVPSLTSNRNPNDPATNLNVPVPKNILNGAGGSTVFADNRTNSIVVKDTPDKYGFYKSLIDKLDVPVAMIEVEAMLVEIDSSSLNQLGMEFGIKGSGGFRFDFPGIDTSNSLNGQAVLGSSSIVDPAKFIARLKALASDSQAKVLSRPTIVTQDNVPAFIDLSETLFLQLQGERVAQVEPVTAGSLLQVTPRLVEGEGSSEIFISVEIQDGALQRNGENSNPSVRNTTLSTQALIDRDKAILIGGYNRESQTEVENKIPVLGSIPFVGKVFSSSSTRKAVEQLKSKFNVEGSALEAPPPIQVYKLDPKLSLGK
jgi:type III secretion protein C